MTKSFLYSCFIHLLFGIVFITVLMQPIPNDQEHRIAIRLTSPAQPIQPSVVSTPPERTPAATPKPVVAPIPVTQPAIIPPKPVPIQNAKPITPTIETPVLRPSIPSSSAMVTQAPPAPSIKTTPSPPAPPPPPVNVEKENKYPYKDEIYKILQQNIKIPKMAASLKLTGAWHVEVKFNLNSDGSISDLKVTKSSDSIIFDDDAVKLINKVAYKFPKPDHQVTVILPLDYTIRGI